MGKEKKNRHKFVSFTERISKLRIDVVHTIEKRTETPDDSETFFQQSLSKWSELNCSLDFQAFSKEVSTLVKSLSLLVHHQKTVVEILQRYLKKKDTLALDALLELCVELSRDLQGDFCAYFMQFLHIIAAHLSTKDAQKIEDCFKTLGYLFKFQWRYLVKDMKVLFRSYSPLLCGGQAGHIHQFAAESFAFLLRKTKDLSGLLDTIFQNVLKNSLLCPGIGRLFAETVRGVQNQFHSCTENVLTLLFGKLGQNNVFKSDITSNKVFEVFVCMFNEMAKYTCKEHTQVVWDCLVNSINSVLSHDGGCMDDSDVVSDQLSLLVQLTNVWTEWRNGELVYNPLQIYKMICALLKKKTMSPSLRSSLLKLISSLLLTNCVELTEEHEKKILHQVFVSKHFSIFDICQFARFLKQWFLFPETFQPKLVSYVETKLSSSSLNSEEVNEVLFMLAEIVVEKVTFEDGFHENSLDDVKNFSFPKLAAKGDKTWWKVLFQLGSEKPLSASMIGNTWASLVCLPFVRPIDVHQVAELLVELLSRFRQDLTSSSESIPVLFLLSQTVKCLSLLCKLHNQNLEEVLSFDVILDVLREHPCDVHVLQACHVYLSVIKEQNLSSVLTGQNLLVVYPCLEKNLSSPARLVRLITLKILTTFEQLNIDNDQCATESLKCSVFEDCLEAELVPLTFGDYRQKLIILKKLVYSNTRCCPNAIKEAPLRYLIGGLYLNLSTMWDPVMSIITTYAVEENKKSFWIVFYEFLGQTSSDAANIKTAKRIPLHSSSCNALSELFQKCLTLCIEAREDNRVDHHNFRLLLWKAMAKFPRVAEPRSRQVVPLFLDFIRNECSVIDNTGKVSYQDLTKADDGLTEDDGGLTEADGGLTEDDGGLTEADGGLTEADGGPKEADCGLTDADGDLTEDDGLTKANGNLTEDDVDLTEDDGCLTEADGGLTEADDGLTEVNDGLTAADGDLTEANGSLSEADGGLSEADGGLTEGDHAKMDVHTMVEDDEDIGKKTTEDYRTRPSTTRPMRMKTLSACLTLFGLFKSPRSLFQAPMMKQLYLTLLTQMDGDIQKLAITCLMTYKFDYLLPYKDNLERLLEDKTFKDELTNFSSSDEELNIVSDEHRGDLMHILIRILYGKMQRWTGAGTRGKSGSGARRALVLRFLNSCHGDEMQVFIDLISRSFKGIFDKDIPTLTNYSLVNVVPLRKQLGFLNMFSQAIEMIGTQATQYLPQLLRILFYCLKISKDALDQRDKLEPRHLSNIKAVRQLGMKCLTKLFDVLPLYDFASIAENVFEFAVWPRIEKLRFESLQSPTSLLRLLNVWSKNPRFFPLLSRVPADSTEGLLVHVFACLSSSHVQAPVVAMVMEIADRLLLHNRSDSEENSDLMHLGFELSFDAISSHESISYGTQLVFPHISTLLDYLSKSVKRTSKDLAKAKGKLSKISAVSKLELSVLSKISPFIVDPDQSRLLVRLMIPILNATRKEEAQIGMLKSITNLLKNVTDSTVFFTPLSRLFSTLHKREARSELCRVFSSIAEQSGCHGEEVRLLHAMNSWNRKQLDEPDFETRLDAFSRAGKLIQAENFEAEVVVPLVLNATYFAMRTTDMALRYSAVGFIRAVVDRVGKDESGTWFDVLVLGCLIPAIREAVKSKEQGARNEFVLILGNVVKRFDHLSFIDLKPLTNDDAEVDFFENIVHIQVHRRIRALRKFSSTCEETSFSTHTLSSFVLPLVTHFIYEYKSSKDHNVVTEAINAIAAISHQLSWQKYSNLLRYYLRILPREKEMQKIIVRIVVSILESFHFDLTALQDKDTEGAADTNVPSTAGVKELKENEEDEDGDRVGKGDETERVDECPLKLKLKIHETISTRILPQLHKCLTKKIGSSDFHRLSGRKADDEDEVLRVPIVLAMVKLLQSLPKKTLQTNLPGLLIRICQALKSRAFEVRETARGTLSKITNSLGIYYFPFILNELRSSLMKGYQLHVLGSTVHYLLTKFEEHIPDGGLDVSAKSIVEVLVEDLFGEPAREREVDKIATKLPEAKSTKSFESIEILAKKITSAQVMAIITPLKEVLDETQSHKTSHRVEEVLRRVSVGLQKNPLFSPQQMLVFVHGLINERLPLLKNNKATEQTLKNEDPRLRTSDTYIVPANPSRGGKAPEVSHKTNAHVLVTFGLQLLLTALKRQKLVSSENEHIKMLDPFVAVLSDALHSKHVKITTLALRCFCLVVKFPLPSLKVHVLQIASRLFKLLKLHARTGGASGDNYEMVLSAFKTITVLIRDFTELKVTDRQLRVLLTFVEEDIHDHTRQSSAFPLLKAILSRKLQVAEINDVMLKVAELSVTDSSSSVRLQCRQVMLQFLLDYSLGKKLRRYLEFFVSQLEYEFASGRESTLEMIITIITSFPEKVVFNNSGLFFLPLCTRLVNDESTNCRKLTAVTIKTLLGKLDVERRDNLFTILFTWMNEEKISLQRLACHVCGLFVEVETQSFDRRLPDLLPILFEIIKPENFDEKATTVDDTEEVRHQEETLKDHLLINALMTLTKILQECSVLKGGKTKMTNEAWGSISNHLLFPHTWIRLMASRLFGLLFSQRTPEQLIKLSKENSPVEYLAVDLEKKVSVLCESFLDQLKARNLGQEIGEQVVKNLFYLSKVVVLLNKETSNNGSQSRDVEQLCDRDVSDDELTLGRLLKTMCNISKYEASQTPKLNQKRLCVLRWIAAIGSHLGQEEVLQYLTQMLQPVYRELDGGSTYTDEKVRNLAQEVAELFKNLVGREAFSHAYSNAKQSASKTKEKRKIQNAFEAVANPEASVAKKIKRNMAKKENRKRKLDAKKPPRKTKRTKVDER